MINVYLISAQFGDKKLYKIGYTKRDINERIKEFKTGNVSDFIIENSFNSKWGTKIEANLHRRFKTQKVRGEWFDLKKEDIDNFENYCKLIHNNLEIIENGNTYFIDRGGRF
jgi:ABC-type Zn uptake system ZnuABC Zn-binding protein ZnuA